MVTTDQQEKDNLVLRFKVNHVPSSSDERRSNYQREQQRRRNDRFQIMRQMQSATQTFMERMEKTNQQQIQETCSFVKQHVEQLQQLIQLDDEVIDEDNTNCIALPTSTNAPSISPVSSMNKTKDHAQQKSNMSKFPAKDTLPCIANILHFLFYSANLGPKRTIHGTVSKIKSLDPQRLHLYRTKFHQIRKRYKTHDVNSHEFYRLAANDYDKWTHYNYPELLELVYIDGIHTKPDTSHA